MKKRDKEKKDLQKTSSGQKVVGKAPSVIFQRE